MRKAITLAFLLLGVVACSNNSKSESKTTTTPVINPGDGGNYAPDIDPADFVDEITNTYLPFTPGSRWVYEGTSEGETERVEVTVIPDRKTVMGISATVLRDTVHVNGELVEDTFDWFAQDNEGNVWYLGEDVKDYENGEVVSTAGSWEAGVDGALPGIVMPANPQIGDVFRQEFYKGEAEDMFEIIEVGASRTAIGQEYTDVVVTRDWSPLEPEVIEEKYYAPDVGNIFSKHVAGSEGQVELVESNVVR